MACQNMSEASIGGTSHEVWRMKRVLLLALLTPIALAVGIFFAQFVYGFLIGLFGQ